MTIFQGKPFDSHYIHIHKKSVACKMCLMGQPSTFFLRIWKAAASCTHILEGHTSAVTSVSILSTKGCSQDLFYFLDTNI